MARNVYGLDLGTYDIKIFDKKKDRIWHAKNVIAMKDKKYIFSVGDDAYEMYEKAPENIQIIFPMKNGVIARFDDMQYLLGDLLKEERPFIRGAEYVIAVPTDVTEVEKKAFYDLVLHSEAKAKSVRIVERGLADGLGLGIDVLEEPGAFIANLGGGRHMGYGYGAGLFLPVHYGIRYDRLRNLPVKDRGYTKGLHPHCIF